MNRLWATISRHVLVLALCLASINVDLHAMNAPSGGQPLTSPSSKKVSVLKKQKSLIQQQLAHDQSVPSTSTTQATPATETTALIGQSTAGHNTDTAAIQARSIETKMAGCKKIIGTVIIVLGAVTVEGVSCGTVYFLTNDWSGSARVGALVYSVALPLGLLYCMSGSLLHEAHHIRKYLMTEFSHYAVPMAHTITSGLEVAGLNYLKSACIDPLINHADYELNQCMGQLAAGLVGVVGIPIAREKLLQYVGHECESTVSDYLKRHLNVFIIAPWNMLTNWIKTETDEYFEAYENSHAANAH